ncbi:hypothetical protein [Halomonas nitroreducens]|uniref:Cytochrome c n=1 Tax=Halomonas nitroreducens TaxID=447425 RepID=A0A431UZG2_9GAMM|nr:hypothetical protein [Halomonas nitroreducens]RTQ99608.1 hypothetical protein EKG36_17205 [Halomonas nitroreducens]
MLVMLFLPVATVANEDHDPARQETGETSSSASSEPKPLEQRVATLEEELARVEASLERLQPDMIMIMPDFAERFHVMHRAGDAGDWAVANHELLTMQQIIERMQRFDPQNGALLDNYMSGPLNKLAEYIEDNDREMFGQALEQTVQVCNACHQAVGSPFIRVTLEPPEALNMRHPHQLQPSEAPREHAHGDAHEAMGDHMPEGEHEQATEDDH